MKKPIVIKLVVVIVIFLCALYIDLPHQNGLRIGNFTRSGDLYLGLDLQGGMQVLLEADVEPGTTVTAEQMSTARKILENRSNGLGVSDIVFQTAGENRILAEFPGMTNADEVLATLKGTGLLEFVDTGDQYFPEGEAIKTDLQHSTSSETNAVNPTSSASSDTNVVNSSSSSSTESAGTAVTALQSSATESITKSVETTAQPSAESSLGNAEGTTQPTAQTSENVEATPQPTAATTEQPAGEEKIYHTVLTGSALKNVTVQMYNNQPVISFELKSEDSKTFADFTSQNVNKFLTIVLDGKVISSPRINEPITDGKGVISGNFTIDSANALAIQLKYGALPVPLKVVEYKLIGATLGEDSLQKSLVAGLIGLSIAVLFMLIYYRLPGLIAVLEIIFYGAVTLAIYKLIPVSLSLSGIAGFLLTTGGAFDANILMFERLKEELRNGKTISQAVGLSWPRAWSSIRDSNIATLITAIILFYFGSSFGASVVKGFAVSLIIGVLISMFSANFVTDTLLHVFTKSIADVPENKSKWFGI